MRPTIESVSGKFLPEHAGLDVQVFRQEAQVIGVPEHVLEQLLRLVFTSESTELIDVPERADVEGRARLAEVIGGVVAEAIGAPERGRTWN